jgi:hypothetical protein
LQALFIIAKALAVATTATAVSTMNMDFIGDLALRVPPTIENLIAADERTLNGTARPFQFERLFGLWEMARMVECGKRQYERRIQQSAHNQASQNIVACDQTNHLPIIRKPGRYGEGLPAAEKSPPRLNTGGCCQHAKTSGKSRVAIVRLNLAATQM